MAFLSLEEINANPIYQPPRHWIEPHPCLDEIQNLDNEKYLKEWFNKFIKKNENGHWEFKKKRKEIFAGHGWGSESEHNTVFGQLWFVNYGKSDPKFNAGRRSKNCVNYFIHNYNLENKGCIDVLNWCKIDNIKNIKKLLKDNNQTGYSRLKRNELINKLMKM